MMVLCRWNPVVFLADHAEVLQVPLVASFEFLEVQMGFLVKQLPAHGLVFVYLLLVQSVELGLGWRFQLVVACPDCSNWASFQPV